MHVSTRHELQTLLDEIKVTQGTAEGSSLAYRVAWILLVAAPLIGLWTVPQLQGPYSGFSLIILLPFFVQSLYSIIQYNVNKRLRPILEAVLYVPEEQPKQAEQIPEKAGGARSLPAKRKSKSGKRHH
jgi:hypothetical protein